MTDNTNPINVKHNKAQEGRELIKPPFAFLERPMNQKQ